MQESLHDAVNFGAIDGPVSGMGAALMVTQQTCFWEQSLCESHVRSVPPAHPWAKLAMHVGPVPPPIFGMQHACGDVHVDPLPQTTMGGPLSTPPAAPSPPLYVPHVQENVPRTRSQASVPNAKRTMPE